MEKHLGLDDESSLIMTSDLNHFEWPGPDIRDSSTEAISFGFSTSQGDDTSA
jgi:hypothetical protein